MKKVLFIIFTILFISSNCFAEKQEWHDKNFDFKKASKVLIEFYFLPPRNGISENETEDIFFEKMSDIYKDLKQQNYKFYVAYNIADMIKEKHNIDIIEIYKTNPSNADELYRSFVKDNMDLVIRTEVMAYDIGSQYYEGYYLTLPSVDTSFVTTPYGSGTVTTYGTKQQYIRGGNVPVSYCSVRFTNYEMKTGNAVWSLIDDRAKANQTIFDNTKPKDLYKRIISNFVNKLKEKLDRTQT